MANPNPVIQTETQFTEGNTCGVPGFHPPGNTKHGGEGAVKAITQGKPFRGLAAETEQQIRADLAELGASGMVEREAIRLSTACELYWNAVKAAADGRKLDDLDKYIKRYGWLAGATLRAWAQVEQSARNSPKLPTLDDLLSTPARSKDDGRDSSH